VRVRRLLPALVLATAVGAVSGCGTFAQSYQPAGVDELTIPTPSPRPADFVATVDNAWLGFGSGATRAYAVTRPGQPPATRTVEVLPGRVDVDGVPTTAVRSTTGADVVTDYYAQDRRGNVWWFGHEAPTGAWRAGRDGAQAGLAMAARPRRADGYRTAYLPGVVEDVATVVAVDARTVEVDVTTELAPGGVTRETYRRGTGLVSSIDAVTGEVDRLQP
jgi:hypothetical protein